MYLYKNYSAQKLDNIWGHLFAYFNRILRLDGGDDYKSPHSGVRARAQSGPSRVSREVDKVAFLKVRARHQ